jgi:hypothetical protein
VARGALRGLPAHAWPDSSWPWVTGHTSGPATRSTSTPTPTGPAAWVDPSRREPSTKSARWPPNSACVRRNPPDATQQQCLALAVATRFQRITAQRARLAGESPHGHCPNRNDRLVGVSASTEPDPVTPQVVLDTHLTWQPTLRTAPYRHISAATLVRIRRRYKRWSFAGAADAYSFTLLDQPSWLTNQALRAICRGQLRREPSRRVAIERTRQGLPSAGRSARRP